MSDQADAIGRTVEGLNPFGSHSITIRQNGGWWTRYTNSNTWTLVKLER